MKKTFVMEFDYNENESGICETFGTTVEEVADIMKKEVELGIEKEISTQTEMLLYMIENEIITGGQLMALVALKLTGDKKEMVKKMLFDSLLKDGDIDIS